MAGRLKRMWAALRRPPARLSLGAVLIIGAVGAWVLLGGFVFTMEKTSTNGFCQSCHEMDIAFAEYQRSVHFRNATGVTATCSDCHIPQHYTIVLQILTDLFDSRIFQNRLQCVQGDLRIELRLAGWRPHGNVARLARRPGKRVADDLRPAGTDRGSLGIE